jgi:hypothetical protein
MKTFINDPNTFSTFDFTTKHYAGKFGKFKARVANIQPLYDMNSTTGIPKEIMILVAKDSDGNFWSPIDDQAVFPVSELIPYILHVCLEIFEFDTAKEKFTWLAENL